jgi:hypothetical protein
MGNHEAEFLDDPATPSAMRDGSDGSGRIGFSTELRARGIDPAAVARGSDDEGRGAWLRDLPLAAKVGRFLFVHSGDTRGMTKDGLSTFIESRVREDGYAATDIAGGGGSVLGSDDWRHTVREARHNARKVGVSLIVMGHVPDALQVRGAIARSATGTIIKLDTGLGNSQGPPRMLRITDAGRVQQLDEEGRVLDVPKVGEHD